MLSRYLHCAHVDAVRVAFEFFSQRAALGFAIPEWLPTPDNVQYHSAVAKLDSAVYDIIADRQQQLAGPQSLPKNQQVWVALQPVVMHAMRPAMHGN